MVLLPFFDSWITHCLGPSFFKPIPEAENGEVEAKAGIHGWMLGSWLKKMSPKKGVFP